MPNLKFIPKNIDQVREVLIDFPANLEIELEIGVPLDAKTVEDLRLLSIWPHGLGLISKKSPDVPGHQGFSRAEYVRWDGPQCDLIRRRRRDAYAPVAAT
jgi:hypothetical protein